MTTNAIHPDLPPADWVSKCGRFVLYRGDCLDVLPKIPKGAVDAVVTDPPYGIGFAGQPTKWQRINGQTPQSWDDAVFPDIEAIVSAAPVACIWGGNYYTLPLSRGWLVWTKPDSPPSMGSVELAWTNQNRCARHLSHSISATNAERVGHPSQKPLAVMRWCVGFMPHGVIIDPFMGSGTTGVACVKTGRRFIGVELDPHYFEVARKRIEQAITDYNGGPMFENVEPQSLYEGGQQ